MTASSWMRVAQEWSCSGGPGRGVPKQPPCNLGGAAAVPPHKHELLSEIPAGHGFLWEVLSRTPCSCLCLRSAQIYCLLGWGTCHRLGRLACCRTSQIPKVLKKNNLVTFCKVLPFKMPGTNPPFSVRKDGRLPTGRFP